MGLLNAEATIAENADRVFIAGSSRVGKPKPVTTGPASAGSARCAERRRSCWRAPTPHADLFQARLWLVQDMASPEGSRQIVFWLFGGLRRATSMKAAIIAATLALATPFLARDDWRMTALKLGDDPPRA